MRAILDRKDFDQWDLPDHHENTPLTDALVLGHPDIARSLIARGAQLTRTVNYINEPRETLAGQAARVLL